MKYIREEGGRAEAGVRVFAILFVHAMGICSGFEICTLKVALGKQIIVCEFSCRLHHKIILFIQVEKSSLIFLDVQKCFLEAKFPLENYSVTKYMLRSPPVPRAPAEHISLSLSRCLLVCETVYTSVAVRTSSEMP